ncbi:Purine efflux pump PbuE [compost metagenome]
MAVARVITGVAASACFGAALAICADMVGTEMRGRAASIVLGGLMLAAALGVPMATLIDQHMGWRASFWLVVILTVLCALVIYVSVPRSQPSTPVGLRAQLREFRNRHLWAAYATSALIIGATFAAFSYFTPILTEVAGFSTASIPWLLGSYGVANIVGNVLVGRYADKYTFAVMAWGLSLLTITLATFALFAHVPAVSVAMLLAVGLVGVTMNPAMVARVMKAAQPGPLVNTVHTSVINIGLGMGTWLGGLGIGAGFGLRSPLWGGVLLAVLGLISLMPYLARRAPLQVA